MYYVVVYLENVDSVVGLRGECEDGRVVVDVLDADGVLAPRAEPRSAPVVDLGGRMKSTALEQRVVESGTTRKKDGPKC